MIVYGIGSKNLYKRVFRKTEKFVLVIATPHKLLFDQ